MRNNSLLIIGSVVTEANIPVLEAGKRQAVK